MVMSRQCCGQLGCIVKGRFAALHAAWPACLAGILALFAGFVEAQDTLGTSPGFLYVEFADDSVTVKARDVTIEDLLKEIAAHSGLMLVLHDSFDKRISVDIQRLSLAKAMSRILHDQNFALQHMHAAATGRLWVFSKAQELTPGVGKDAKDGSLLASLRLALANSDAQARLEAVSALADIGNDQAAAVLAAALTDSDPRVREEAVYALGEIGGETAIPVIEQAFMDTEHDVRSAAIEALSDIGGDESARALAVALYDENASLREEAVYALGEIGGGTAIDLLHGALLDHNRAVSETAGDILAELSNQKM